MSSFVIHDFGVPTPAPTAATAATASTASPQAISAAARALCKVAEKSIDAQFFSSGNPYRPKASVGSKTVEHAAVFEVLAPEEIASVLVAHHAVLDREAVLGAFVEELTTMLRGGDFELAAHDVASGGSVRVAITDPAYVAAAKAADEQVERLFNDPGMSPPYGREPERY